MNKCVNGIKLARKRGGGRRRAGGYIFVCVDVDVVVARCCWSLSHILRGARR